MSDDRTPIFEFSGDWEGSPLRRAHPLALVARVLAVLEDLASGPMVRNENPEWLLVGVSSALGGLCKAGAYDSAGLLLMALEELAPADRRNWWPLAGWEDDPPAWQDELAGGGGSSDVPAAFREAAQ